MFRIPDLSFDRRCLSRSVCLALLIAAVFVAAACSSNQSAPEGKRYAMTGKVLSVAKEGGTATIDANAIPGWMAAMAMPYPIPDEKALFGLAPGDEIKADVVVTNDGKYHLENIVVTKKANGSGKSPSS